jgi:hypothetical protein
MRCPLGVRQRRTCRPSSTGSFHASRKLHLKDGNDREALVKR